MTKLPSQFNRRLILGTLAFLIAGTLLSGVPYLFSRTTVPTAAAAAPRTGARPLTNPITIENAKPGTDEWADLGWTDPANLDAYAGATQSTFMSTTKVHPSPGGCTGWATTRTTARA